MTAWGLEMNISTWAKEPFVQVSKATLTRRIAAGWKPEAALIGEPFESEEEALERTQTPPWKMGLGDFVRLALRGRLTT